MDRLLDPHSNNNMLVNRKKPTLAIFDLDGTITRRDTYLSYLIGFALRHPRVWRFTKLPLDVLRYKAGMRKNTWLKQRFLSAVLGGTDQREIDLWTNAFLDRAASCWLYPGAVRQIQAHRHQGDRLILVSASLDLYVKGFAQVLGFSECLCTVVEWTSSGKLSGRLAGPNCYGDEKIQRVLSLLGKERRNWWVIVYSDHYSDMPLLTWADQAIVVNPANRFARQARKMGLTIVDWQ